MDAQHPNVSDNTIVCVVLFIFLLVAVLGHIQALHDLRTDFARGFHDGLEYATLKWQYVKSHDAASSCLDAPGLDVIELPQLSSLRSIE